MRYFAICFFLFLFAQSAISQDYFTSKYGPFDPSIPSPESFLGYPIGTHHTRYDRMVAYLTHLAELSDRASIQTYGQTYGHRPLVLFSVAHPSLLDNMESIREQHLAFIMEGTAPSEKLPLVLNLGYNVHGNEPSGGEASLLTAYILVASSHPEVEKFRTESISFIDPTINPDGRDRHSHWVNMHKGSPMVSDPLDIEHNEGWPRGRTNHYWFDLNRDWWLAIHPESRGKLKWYHSWYPNVVTDFHEMGTNSTFFFEPMKANGSKVPTMPKENYGLLNETFAHYFSESMNEIGSLYFTKEVFDGTYPGYGSSYPDLQGGLGLLFEQASSRGHVQETPSGDLTFAFTIRNQLVQSIATIRAAVENAEMLQSYQREFFESAPGLGRKDPVSGYVFGQNHDPARMDAFVDKLLLHGVEVYALTEDLEIDGQTFSADGSYVVPTAQRQYRIVQNVFETYSEYADSVFYDASAWSLVNFYNIPYRASLREVALGSKVESVTTRSLPAPASSDYAYLIDWKDYYAPAALQQLHDHSVRVSSAFRPFSLEIGGTEKSFDRGTLIIHVQRQEMEAAELHRMMEELTSDFGVRVTAVDGGYSKSGIDLGSRYMRMLEAPKVVLLVGNSVSGYEAGEVWHLLDQRFNLPITKLRLDMFDRLDLDGYNTLVMVSGSYPQLDSSRRKKIADWVQQGNTLITIRGASDWVIKKGLVTERIYKEEDKKEDERPRALDRLPYDQAAELLGRTRVGGAIFKVALDLSHPLCFGYQDAEIPVYRNSTVWMAPSKNAYSTVAKYTEDPHVDGYISSSNLEEKLKPSASLLVSRKGGGRVVMFADNPNFRGSWYGT
ncbi:MAG: zinc carboxypeptidase, partial [Saprospiraceae bacterium]|nr:zinc carboxypeptidase [Saprospiraceae bacterium]